MLDLEQIVNFYPGAIHPFKKNILREFLQFKLLAIVFDTEYAHKLVFTGGTAIRIFLGNNRFSEDLDFDNFNLQKSEFVKLSDIIKKKLAGEGYEIEIRNVFKGAFHSYITFNNLLYEYKLSRHKSEKLVIRLDTEAQQFDYKPEQIILNKFDVFTRVNVAPESILLSQKLLAILFRKRPMGRDFYDVIFLSGKTVPDFFYLKKRGNIGSPEELKDRILQKIQSLDMKRLIKDVEPFLIQSNDAKKILLFEEYITNITFDVSSR